MYKINKHPILDIGEKEKVRFSFEEKEVVGEKGFTIAAALHREGGFPVET